MSAPPRVVNLFASAGGWDVAARLIGLQGVLGVDVDPVACATARQAGFPRIEGDVAALSPEEFEGITGVIASPPCPTFSAAGTGSGRSDLATVHAAIDGLGVTLTDGSWRPAYGRCTDARTALIIDAVRLAVRVADLDWVVAEQVPAAGPVWQDLAAELAVDGFATCHVAVVEAADLGVASRRRRSFLIATRHAYTDLAEVPVREWWSCGRWDAPRPRSPQAVPWPQTSMAQALGWPTGQRVNTRGNRRTSGGNEFAADEVSWCLTEKARSWRRTDGARLTPEQAGILVGFPPGHPWQGSRSRQFLQAADAVSPPVGAAVLATAAGLPWREAVRDYLAALYPSAPDADLSGQLTLFDIPQAS